MKIRVRNRVTGKVYECFEEDYLRARRKGAALVKIGDAKPEPKRVPSFAKEEIENVPEPENEEVEKPKQKRKRTRKKAGDKDKI